MDAPLTLGMRFGDKRADVIEYIRADVVAKWLEEAQRKRFEPLPRRKGEPFEMLNGDEQRRVAVDTKVDADAVAE